MIKQVFLPVTFNMPENYTYNLWSVEQKEAFDKSNQKKVSVAEAELNHALKSGYEVISSTVIESTNGQSVHYLLHQDFDIDSPIPYTVKKDRLSLFDNMPTDAEIQSAIDEAVEAGYIEPVSNGNAPEPELSPLEAFKQMVRTGNFIVLDTETTGLNDGEICQIAIIDSGGVPLLETFVKTINPIPPSATAIHGITDETVKEYPTWERVAPMVESIVANYDNLIVYNATYDRKMMHQSAEKAGMPKTEWKELIQWHCAMLMFAEEYGEWNEYHGNYKWQSLSKAAGYYDIPVVDAHDALADCNMTLAVINQMATESDLASN